MRIVIDTNVLLSALMSAASPPARILALWRSRKFDLLTSAEQIGEIARVSRYPKIRARLSRSLAGRFINGLQDVALVIENLPTVTLSPDPDDNHILALCEAGQADFLITGDKPLLALKRHKSTNFVTPSVFLARFKD